MKRERLFFCGECDDWKGGPYCPDCGHPCAEYVRRSDGVTIGGPRLELASPATPAASPAVRPERPTPHGDSTGTPPSKEQRQ